MYKLNKVIRIFIYSSSYYRSATHKQYQRRLEQRFCTDG